jgi:hypothetical protein
MLRCVPDAQRVARLLTQAWADATGNSAEPRAAAAPSRGTSTNGRPAMAGH